MLSPGTGKAPRTAPARALPIPTPPTLHTFSYANGRAPSLDGTAILNCKGFTVAFDGADNVYVEISTEELIDGALLQVSKKTMRNYLAPLYD